MSFLRALPVQLILSIAVAFVIGSQVDIAVIRGFFTISHFFVDILLFFLPFMVFSFIFRALTNIQRGSGWVVLLILGGVTLSNMLALWTAFGTAHFTLDFMGMKHCPGFVEKFSSSILPYFNLPLPTIMSTDKAMLLGVGLALFTNLVIKDNSIKEKTRSFAIFLSDSITSLLQRFFIPLLPLYVFGFCLKLSYEKALVHLFYAYGHVFLLSIGLVVSYLSIMYFIAAKFSISKALSAIKTMFPAGLTGFSTMSSAATLPVTLGCTETNTQDRNYTDLVIPSTANIHMLGDDLTIVMTAMALLSICGTSTPDLSTFFIFSLAFCVAKLSCVGIPGASVLVVLPVLQQFLGFSPEMISMLTTIYILQDPFGTAANVMGNGAFAMILQKPFKMIAKDN